MRIRFVSNNPEKIKEVQRLVEGAEIVSANIKINEIQTNDEQVLVHDKLLKAFKEVGREVLVEHTGLYVKSLNDFPGGLTQVFWDKLEADKFTELFGQLEEKTLIARTTIGYCDAKKFYFFSAEVEGTIASEPRGDRSFQWDCIFIPNGESETFAEMGDRKNLISMRKLAFDEFNQFLKGN